MGNMYLFVVEDVYDKRKSVYSPGAIMMRKIEILAVNFDEQEELDKEIQQEIETTKRDDSVPDDQSAEGTDSDGGFQSFDDDEDGDDSGGGFESFEEEDDAGGGNTAE